jgi:hypothetical protein
MSSQQIIWTFAVGLTVIAGLVDFRTRKIPNWLTVPAIVGGLLLRTLLGGWAGAGLIAAARFAARLGCGRLETDGRGGRISWPSLIFVRIVREHYGVRVDGCGGDGTHQACEGNISQYGNPGERIRLIWTAKKS